MKLAILGPSFFGYLERLAVMFGKRGLPAEFFDERPSNSVGGKIFLRFAPTRLRDGAVRAHFEVICAAIEAGGFTHLLLVSPEATPVWAIERLRGAGLRLVRYSWDSVANKPQMAKLDPFMHAIASFDPGDCARFGHDLIPLYSDTVATGAAPARDIDMMYCATLHSDRPAWIRDLQRVCRRRGWSLNLMLFYHSRVLWLLRYARGPAVWPLLSQISTKSFDRQTLVDATRGSKVVLDLHHTGQTGLTMRTFEALSLGAMVVSTNAEGTATLPSGLHHRVVLVAGRDLEAALESALARLPLPPLSDQDSYDLSVDRFLDQLETLVAGSVPRNHKEAIA